MPKLTILPIEMLNKFFEYNPKTGLLFWKKVDSSCFENGKYSAERICKSFNAKFAGKEALTAINSDGYKKGSLLKNSLSSHRVCWAIYYGEWPSFYIDHMNGNKTDNRIDNLRDVSQVENQRNQFIRSDNKSGCVGVHFCQKTKKWIAQSYFEPKKRKFIGRFKCIEDAVNARKNAEIGMLYSNRHGNKHKE